MKMNVMSMWSRRVCRFGERQPAEAPRTRRPSRTATGSRTALPLAQRHTCGSPEAHLRQRFRAGGVPTQPFAPSGAATGRLVHCAASAVAGALIVKGATKPLHPAKPAARKAVVEGLAQSIRTGRWLASFAEEARLKAGDVLAEARIPLGEEVPPPSEVAPRATGTSTDHVRCDCPLPDHGPDPSASRCSGSMPLV
ncbi:DUF1490 family protein [Streptomyces sclerotialus]|uniref:DUF1490 family protein n=1 Tax=Streptomyces sclerotialus TaxID=1957 RepID=UPI0034A45F8C